jgi:hypothetical protein
LLCHFDMIFLTLKWCIPLPVSGFGPSNGPACKIPFSQPQLNQVGPEELNNSTHTRKYVKMKIVME